MGTQQAGLIPLCESLLSLCYYIVITKGLSAVFKYLQKL